MAGGKIHHWKHGWIPLDAYAVGVLAKRKRPVLAEKNFTIEKTPAGTYRIKDSKGNVQLSVADKSHAQAWIKHKGGVDVSGPEVPKTREQARLEAAGIAQRQEVDGVTFDSYIPGADPSEAVRPYRPVSFTPEQQKEIAGYVNEFHGAFPKMKPVRIVGMADHDDFGITEWDGRRISLSGDLFDPKAIAKARKNFGQGGAVVTDSSRTDEEFRRAVVAHEMGHVLELQNEDARRYGSGIANERVPPAMYPRWGTDRLDNHTLYGLANEYEWFAEAFADGYLNGPKASDWGFQAVEHMRLTYGGAT